MSPSEPSHEALWAREGDAMVEHHQKGQWSPLASFRSPWDRSQARERMHGFDFRIESERGKKTMVKLRRGSTTLPRV